MPRIVYSIQIDVEPSQQGELVSFIAPLDQHGNGKYIRGLDPNKRRVVDLRPGDWFLHRHSKRPHRIKTMKAYRQHHVTEEALRRKTTIDGFVVHDQDHVESAG